MTAQKPLSSKQAQYLRGLAHHLEPVVLLGKEGLTEKVIEAVDVALLTHELIKVKLPQVEKAERQALAEALVEATNAGLAGQIGRMVLLYRRHPNKPKIALPRR